MKDDILQSDVEENFEDDIAEIEEEEKETETKKSKPVAKEEEAEQQDKVTNTWEAYAQPAQCMIVNTLTGEVIGGFDSERDKAVIQLGATMLNKLDKIAIASGV